MRIDSITLLSCTFGYGRASVPSCAVLLPLLPDVVALVRQTRCFVVELPPKRVKVLPVDIRWRVKAGWLGGRGRRDQLTPASQPFFDLVDAGAADLRRLWDQGEHAATRSLCYAFHNLPRFLRFPAEFDRNSYDHCFMIAGRHWPLLSPALQAQLCQVMGWTEVEGRAFLVRQGVQAK